MTWLTWGLVFIMLQLIHFLGTHRLYVRAGRKAWEAAVPFYSVAVWLAIINRPKKFFFIAFLPVVGVIMLMVLWYDTALSFGKDKKQGILTILTLGFYLYYLSYVDKSPYTPIVERKETFFSAIIFAVIVATVVHLFGVQPFMIPTGSMEKTLLVGDGLFVNKWTYGYRVPQAPIALPFLQNYIPYTGKQEMKSNGAIVWEKRPIRSYIESVLIPYTRFFQFKKVKLNDIVVFNYPKDSLNVVVDRKDPYVKRCVGTPGTTLEIKDGISYIDNKVLEYPADAKLCSSYWVKTNKPFNDKYLTETPYLITDPANLIRVAENEYYFNSLTKEEAQMLEKLSMVVSVKEDITDCSVAEQESAGGETFNIFPAGSNWNRDQYGPLYIPKKGDVITLTADNINSYRDIITTYEQHDLEETPTGFLIDGNPSTQYTIAQDYYFMMGDNRHNSLDSRYFGFVPEDHILGAPFLTWLSIDWKKGKSIRFDRMITVPNTGEKDKKSYLWLVLVIIAAYIGYSYFMKGKDKK